MEIQHGIESLSPNHDVVNFYRSKCEKYERRITDMLDKLEEYRLKHEQQVNLERRLRDVIDQNESLRLSLSKLREHLFEDRDAALRLKSENGRLRLQELEDRKKIHYLLTIRGCADENVVALFMEHGVDVSKLSGQLESMNLQVAGGISPQCVANFAIQTENDVLNLQVKALQAELSDRIQFALHERVALVSEKQMAQRDYELRKLNDSAVIDSLNERVKILHNALNKDIRGQSSAKKLVSVPEVYTYSSAAESAVPRSKILRPSRSNDNVAVRKSSLDGLPSSLENLRKMEQPRESLSKRGQTIVENLQRRLKRSDDLRAIQEQRILELRENIKTLEKSVEIRGEPTKNNYTGLKERVQILHTRNQDLERRRKLENEGFQSDIKFLREQLHSVEKQLLKFVLNAGATDENVDFSDLEAVERSSHGRTKAAASVKLKDLRARMEKTQGRRD